MEKIFKNIPIYIIESVLAQKFQEFPDSIQINERYLRMLENRIKAGIPGEIAIALNMLDPIYSQAYKIKRRGSLSDEEVQGYLDTLALFITVWVEESTSEDEEASTPFSLSQIPEYTTFAPEFQQDTDACLAANLDWARSGIDRNAPPDGKQLMFHIVEGLLKVEKPELYTQGVITARATYMLHRDLVRSFFPTTSV